MRAGYALLAGIRGALAGLMAEVEECYVVTTLVDADRCPDALNRDVTQQVLGVIRTYLK